MELRTYLVHGSEVVVEYDDEKSRLPFLVDRCRFSWTGRNLGGRSFSAVGETVKEYSIK
jgi:hypothetical protein